jgi:elongation factor 1-alpha
MSDAKDPPFITDIGVAIAGSVDSGKSTFIGVITTGVLDDGNGKARESVAKHPHEIANGKTSDISTRMFTVPGSRRAITMIDLCGHEKYLKTTTFGISGHYPDYAFVIVSANRGILPMTKQHFTLLMSLNIPIAVILTRPDLSPKETYNDTKDSIETYCMKAWNTKVNFVNDYYDTTETPEYGKKVSALVKDLMSPLNGRQTFIPVVTVSNKTGYFIDTVKSILSSLEQRNFWDNFDYDVPEEFGKGDVPNMPLDKRSVCNNRIIRGFMTHMKNPSIFPPFEKFTGSIFYIDSVFNPPGIGLVISGIARGNILKVGTTMHIGPIARKDPFENELRIKSIHNNVRESTGFLDHHHRGCMAVAPVTKKDMITRDTIKRGMVLISPKSLANNVCFRFHAVITVFNHPATLKSGYCPNLHMGTIRQTVRMHLDPEKNGGKNEIKSNDYAIVTFKFKSNPEYVEPYQVFIFRSGAIHGIGVVIGIVSLDEDKDAKPDPLKYKRRFAHKRERAKNDKSVKGAVTTS